MMDKKIRITRRTAKRVREVLNEILPAVKDEVLRTGMSWSRKKDLRSAYCLGAGDLTVSLMLKLSELEEGVKK